jgi:glycosyltransferase involved in cell wall biosynthesis
MRIVIDLQGAQTESRFRGIGRYSLSLALAMVQHAGDHEISLVLNAAFPERLPELRQAFDRFIPSERLRVFHVPTPIAEHNPANAWRARAAEKLREHFIQRLRPDVVLVTSMFEGLSDDAVTSIGTLPRTVPTASILYDLIPLVHHHPYLDNPVIEAWYKNKLDHLRRADVLLAISESSRQEAIRYLDFPAEAAVNISTAADPHFQPIHIGPEQAAVMRERYGLHRPFVMYTGGIDHRKNIEALISAYAKLPEPLRVAHQLAVVCAIQPSSRAELDGLAKTQGLQPDELVLTGFVPEDDLVTLYNLATLFVFPSKHEGFGLPVLEAMACGAPTIGSNTTSVPEVIGWDEALFDPASEQSMTSKMAQVLTDEGLRGRLREYGLQQAAKFSWDTSATRAISALEALHSRQCQDTRCITPSTRRPKLAYVSPLPPERSGISDYSADLLPLLALDYDIEVIVAQQTISDPWINANCPVRSVEWFQRNASAYERVLYHFGNSHFHSHMFDLLRLYPGVVVLHDFFLSGELAFEEATGAMPGAWTTALYHSHGYAAVQQRFQVTDTADVVWTYPCNLAVLQSALGVIVHAENSRRLGTRWYGPPAAADWESIPLLRVPAHDRDRAKARDALNLTHEAFVVCSFGLLAPTKLNHRLLSAWLASALAKHGDCVLVFVGDNSDRDYGGRLLTAIRHSGMEERVRITGWVDGDMFRHYLAAADVGVQLRALSRGETSAAVLDCMNHGLATIINAHGSMADLPADAVWMLNDDFTNAELVEALETLWRDDERRSQLASRAREVIRTQHDPAECAAQYTRTIEAMYHRGATDRHALVTAIAASDNLPSDAAALGLIAASIALTCLPSPFQQQVLVDVSSIVRTDPPPRMESVVRGQLLAMLNDPPGGFRVEPIYLTDRGGQWHYRYARSYTCKILGIERADLPDAPVDIAPGDVFYALYASSGTPIGAARSRDRLPRAVEGAAASAILSKWKAAGVSIQRQLLVDVSSIAQTDLKTGVERVVSGLVSALIKDPPEGFRIEPVYLTAQGAQSHYRYARPYTCRMLGIEQANLSDGPIDVRPGDVFYGLDFSPGSVIEAAKSGIYAKWKATGVSISFLVYDLLPILRPEFFPDDASIIHSAWLKACAESATRVICISNAVAGELRSWLKDNPPARKDQLIVNAIHPGADITASAPSAELPEDAVQVLRNVRATPSFLVVGTIEPRKGHWQTLAAFEQLWRDGNPSCLLIVGREGWTHLPPDQRRAIPDIVDRLRKHPELGRRLFWLEGISDQYLEALYRNGVCLIASSEGEGFGLPLIEAARYGLPIIARDLPVFHEVAEANAYYFSGLAPAELAAAITDWLRLHAMGKAPSSVAMRWRTWTQNAQELATVLSGHSMVEPLCNAKPSRTGLYNTVGSLFARLFARRSTFNMDRSASGVAGRSLRSKGETT